MADLANTSRPPRRAAVLAALAVGVGVLCGCGSGSDQLSAAAADALHRDVQAIRVAAQNGAAATGAVEALRGRLRQMAAAGEMNASDAAVLLAHTGRIAATLATRAPGPAVAPPVEESEKGERNRRDERGGDGERERDRRDDRGDREREKDERGGRDAGEDDDRGGGDDEDDDDD